MNPRSTRVPRPIHPCTTAPPSHLISSDPAQTKTAVDEGSGVVLPRHAAGELFLRGPIPFGWLEAASRCGGKALHVGLCIWHHAFMQKSGRVSVSMTRAAARMGFDRTTALRALKSLERAGLAELDCLPGRSPVVTLHWPPVAPGRHPEGGRALASVPSATRESIESNDDRTR